MRSRERHSEESVYDRGVEVLDPEQLANGGL